ncbi:hypothetical protein F5Y19DRAFT_416209 [Xylariaceae sp. FL1651]|nr:hypothetical protein F5Y19DRAFT_416209 [Xylariaceae sp. FL1651]
MHFEALVMAACAAFASAQSATPVPSKTTVTSTATQSAGEDACDSSQLSIIGGIPTPPPAFSAAVTGSLFINTDLSAICAFETNLPSSSLSAYTSYNNAVYSYLQDKSSDYMAIASTCSISTKSGEPPATKEFNDILSVYSTFSASGCSSSAVQTSSTPTGAAPRETGRAVAAAAMMVAGAVAVL